MGHDCKRWRSVAHWAVDAMDLPVALVRQTSDRWRWAMNEPQPKLSEGNDHTSQRFLHGNGIKLHVVTHGPENKMYDSNAIPRDETSTGYISAFQEFSTHLRRQGNQRCVSCVSARNQELNTTLAMMRAGMRRSFSSYLKGLQQHWLPFRKCHLRVGRKSNERTFQPVSCDGFEHGVCVPESIRSEINVVHPLVDRHTNRTPISRSRSELTRTKTFLKEVEGDAWDLGRPLSNCRAYLQRTPEAGAQRAAVWCSGCELAQATPGGRFKQAETSCL